MKVNSFRPEVQQIFNILSYCTTLFCIGFVIYKGRECIAKFLTKPESSIVTIEHASKHNYPSLTFCLPNPYNSEILAKCSIQPFEYRYPSQTVTLAIRDSLVRDDILEYQSSQNVITGFASP